MAESSDMITSDWVSGGYRKRLLTLLNWDDSQDGTRGKIIEELTSILYVATKLPRSEMARTTYLFLSKIFQEWLSTTTNSVDAVLTFNSNEGEVVLYDTSPTSLACAIIDLHLSMAGYFVMTWYAYQVSEGTTFDMMCRFCAALISEFFCDERDQDLEFIKKSGLYDVLATADFTKYPSYEEFDAICSLWDSLMSRLPHDAKVIVMVDGIDTMECQSEEEMERARAVVDIFIHTVKAKRGVRRHRMEGYPEALPSINEEGKFISSKTQQFSTSNRQFKLLVTAHTFTSKGQNWYNKPCRLDHPEGPTPLQDVPIDMQGDPERIFLEVAGLDSAPQLSAELPK